MRPFPKEAVMAINDPSYEVAAEESVNKLSRRIEVFLSKVTWRMVDFEGRPKFDWDIRRGIIRADTTSDLATQFSLDVDVLVVRSLEKKSVFRDIVSPYVSNADKKIDFARHKMIRVRWSELAPVGGISIVENVEIDLYPLRLQLSYDIGMSLINYLYPTTPKSLHSEANSSDPNSPEPLAGGDALPKGNSRFPTIATAQARGLLHRHDVGKQKAVVPSGDGSAKAAPKKDNMFIITAPQDQVDQIKQRASKNKTFIYIRIPGRKHCISYHGRKDKNVEDLRDFVFRSPTLEFHNKVESFYELMMEVKSEMKTAVFQHTAALLREKLKQLHSSKAWRRREKESFANQLLRNIDESQGISESELESVDENEEKERRKEDAGAVAEGEASGSGGDENGKDEDAGSGNDDATDSGSMRGVLSKGFKFESGQLETNPNMVRTSLINPRKLMPRDMSMALLATKSSIVNMRAI
ncbi:Protein SABRE, partial [Spiromyces aspiralis]